MPARKLADLSQEANLLKSDCSKEATLKFLEL